LVEKIVKKTWNVLEKPGDAAKLAFGGALLFQGSQFSYLALHMQAVRMTGWSSIKAGILEFGDTYQRTRETLKAEYPNLMKTKALLEKNKGEIASLKNSYSETTQALKDGTMNSDDAKAMLEQVKKDMKEMKAKSAEMEASLSSINALTKAVDPDRMKEVLHGIYIALMNSFAVANSQMFGQVALGYNIGNMMSRITETIQQRGKKIAGKADEEANKLKLSDKEKKWLKTGFNTIVHTASVAAAVMLENTMLTVGTCLLGGMIVSDIVIKHVDPVLENNGLPVIGDDAAKKSMFQYILAGVGFVSQLGIFSNKKLLSRTLLFPFIAADKKLRAMKKGAP